MKHLSILMFILSTTVIAQAQEEEFLQSPYFIDDIHCSGVSNESPEEVAYFADEEDKAYVVQAVKSQLCYNLFSAYGVKKHEWYNPSELKDFLYSLKYSGTVEDADLEIKKSELKNHVHLFLTVTPFKTSKKTVEIDATYYAAADQEASRQLYRYKVEWDNQKGLPLVNWSIGAEHLTTDAGSLYQVEEGSLTARESELFAKEDFQLTDIYVKSYSMLGGLRFDYGGDIYIHDNNEQRATDVASTYAVDLGTQNYRGLLGNTYFGIGVLGGFFNSHEFNNEGIQEDLSVIYAGVKMNSQIGNSRGRYTFIDAQAYQSVKGEDSSFYKLGVEFGWTMQSIANQFIVETSIDSYTNAQLPHHRLLLTDYDFHDMAVGLRNYTKFGDFTLKLGYESLYAAKAGTNVEVSPYMALAGYLDLGYVSSLYGYDIKLGVRLADQRTF